MRDGGPARLAVIGSGWIMPAHLAALDRLGRTTLVGVASPTLEHAEDLAVPRAAPAFTDPERMLDEVRPDAVIAAVPPGAAVAVGEALLARRIPFLIEKPLAAGDADGPERLGASIAASGLAVAVGYHLRSIVALDEVRAVLMAHPAQVVTGRWLDTTPGPAWWRRAATGGGQVVEQATHLYDIARALVGEAEVVGAASTRHDPLPHPDDDVMDATAAVLRFAGGAVGAFANTRRLTTAVVEVEIATTGPLVTLTRLDGDSGRWQIVIEDGGDRRVIPPGRDPYEVQAEAFLDAVAAGDPSLVRCTYADALGTYRLTRDVVRASGRPG
jgi:myo-inositol 2-dehydrogenase / D-chiro-inositol 1-dehydrogenase